MPLLAREQSLVVAGVEVIGRQLPVPIRGIDSDNDGAFINETLMTYCKTNQIEFTRSRAYHSNDQAWIEQKNGAVIRRFIGYERNCGPVAGQAFAHLYGAMRLYVNYFQPSFKLIEKVRNGAKVTKRYDKPTTPCDRLLNHEMVTVERKHALCEQRIKLDPVALLHNIRETQAALATLAFPDAMTSRGRESLEQFLSKLPNLWRLGEVRPTHSPRPKRARAWRTRKDPFEGVWSEVLLWLQRDPDMTPKDIFGKLRGLYHPGQWKDGQLRTLQRRVQGWRTIMAKELVYASLNPAQPAIIEPIGTEFMDKTLGNIPQ